MAKPEQGHLDGMTPERDEQLHSLATSYAESRDERMAAGLEESAKKNQLIGAMRAKKMEHYHDDTVTIDLKTKDDIKVKVAAAPSDDPEDPDGE